MKYRSLLTAIVIVMLALASMLAYAQNEPNATATPAASSVIQEDIFVRGGPGRDYLPVGKLLAGDRVRPLSRNVTSDWILIAYGKNYGWIRRDLAFWVENIDTLPIMDTANLTPSPVIPTTPANTPILAATETPSGNWVELDSEAQSGLVRGGPGRTYLRLGQLFTGDEVEPISRNEDGTWVMIRFGDGFGWIARNLVRWIDDIDSLPVIARDNLTPTATFTVTNTPTVTPTPTHTSTPTGTSTLTPTYTSTPSATPTATSTLTPTYTSTPSATSTATSTYTNTPSATATLTPTYTLIATNTQIPSHTFTLTAVPGETQSPTFTATIPPSITATPTQPSIIPTATNTALSPTSTHSLVPPSATITVTPSATATHTETLAAIAVVPSATATIPPTNTSIPITLTTTYTPSVTHTQVPTSIPASSTPFPPTYTLRPTTVVPVPTKTTIQVTTATAQLSPTASMSSVAIDSTPLSTAIPETTPSPSDNSLPAEAIIAGLALLIIGIYGYFYWRGLSTVERYANGFVIDNCPVCGRGHLIVETRQERTVGIPRVRHSVRCSECRSVLREIGDQQWRYAVDPIESPDLYQQYNGQLITDETLMELTVKQAQNDHQQNNP